MKQENICKKYKNKKSLKAQEFAILYCRFLGFFACIEFYNFNRTFTLFLLYLSLLLSLLLLKNNKRTDCSDIEAEFIEL